MKNFGWNAVLLSGRVTRFAKFATLLTIPFIAVLVLRESAAARQQSVAATSGSKASGAQAGGAGSSGENAASAKGGPMDASHLDLTKTPTLFIVNYAHLDTEWRWEYPQTIQEYLTKTMRDNFALFKKYPHYVFNFTGANRYMYMKEYDPADYAELKKYVAEGRWFPAGSSMEENDVNSPNAESIIRQVLYGNEYFRKEFGKASSEYMLPDCFGFPASLPSILHHAGILGFSTQKLSSGWQPAPRVGGPDSPEHTPEGIPFNVGIWEGTDGNTIIAALNPSGYGSQVTTDLTKDNPKPAGNTGDYVFDWPARIDYNGKVTGVYTDYHYVGTGDIGGSPDEYSVKMLEAIEDKATTVIPPAGRGGRGAPPPQPGPPVKVGDGPLKVVETRADQMFLDIKPNETSKMPRYKGDLELIEHSAGSITSETYHKRWNRENELLATAAEESSVGAAWLGGRAYPQERLNRAWRLVLAGQFHDSMAGTATPKSYEYIWNDDVLAMNQFAGVITSATSAIASGMDTRAEGTAIVVYNPLNIAREDVVEATVWFAGATPQGVTVIGPDGTEVPAQLDGHDPDGGMKVLFLAKVPSAGYAVYDVQRSNTANVPSSQMAVSENVMENARYRLTINGNGDVSSVFDKKLNKELLTAPIQLGIITDNPRQWPAWNMDYQQEIAEPRTTVGGPAHFRVVENGPVRVALEVSREAEGSTFVQTIRLSAGDAGNRVEFGNVIDWHTKEGNLKAVFPLTARNRTATYNWDIGTVDRPNEDERQFEVASHQWIDLTDKSGSYGVTVLTDDKNASDKHADNQLRLTLIRTPGTRGGYPDQGSQDLGHHEFVFGLASHEGDWRSDETVWQALRLNQPLIAFVSASHSGALGKAFSMLKVNDDHVRVLAFKKAEQTDEEIVRFVDIGGKGVANVHVGFAGTLVAAREVNGQEMPLAGATPAKIAGGELATSLTPYQVRSFAVKLVPATKKVATPESKPVELSYDISVASHDNRPAEGAFDWLPNSPAQAQGKAIPAEMLPEDVAFAAVHFKLAPAGTGRPDAETAMGQTIALPAGKYNRVYILAASYGGGRGGGGGIEPQGPPPDVRATFKLGDKPTDLTIQNWTGYIGQWDNRNWETKDEQQTINRPAGAPPLPPRTVRVSEFTGVLTPGFIKRADVAWFASHRHDSAGLNEAYAYSYLFAYSVDIPEGAKTLTLPNNERIRILAISVANEPEPVTPAHPLYDTLERQEH